MALPTVVAHADWSSDRRKQRLAVARLVDGRYRAEAPRPAGDPHDLLARLRREAGSGGVLAGFDFPIGVPRAWAASVGVESFPALLPRLGAGEWSSFFEPAGRPSEIDGRRPFYPARPGGTRQSDLVAGLGVVSMDDLLRRCDRRTDRRRAACAIFWTLGANQVGRAAIAGWRQVLQPAVGQLAIWPFDGPLAELLATRELVVVETYPAETAARLGLLGAKTDRAARAANATALAEEATRLGVEFERGLAEEAESGFDSDDDFDAVIGLLGMLGVVTGALASGEPRDDDAVVRIEGWIVGQAGPEQLLRLPPPTRRQPRTTEAPAPASLAELSENEVHALAAAAAWYAKRHESMISERSDDVSASAVAERERYLTLHAALWKLGVRLRLPDGIDPPS